MTAAAALELAGVRKAYGERLVLDGIDLSAAAGEIVALLGPNGAGKTTSAEIGLGLRTPDAGTARLFGRDAARPDRATRARIGATLERGGLPRPVRVAEALRLHAAFWADPADPDELLERLGLSRVGGSAYRSLSAGERARLALALALVGRPDLCVLDEPTAAMDVAVRRETWLLLAELRERGAAILLTTHLLDEATALADRVVVLDEGRVVAAGPPASIGSGRPRGRLELDAPLDEAALAAFGERGVTVKALGGDAYRLVGQRDGTDADGIVAAVAACLPPSGRRIRAFEVGPEGLEELLAALATGREA